VTELSNLILYLATAATYLAVGSSLFWIVALAVGLRKNAANWVESGRRAAVVTSALVVFATLTLVWALVANHWHIQYVWQTSLPEQPLIYKVGALWGGMSGSMLFWLCILAASAWILVRSTRTEPDALTNYALLVVGVVTLFFAVLVAGWIPGVENPFKWLDAEHIRAINTGDAIRGRGLNPLLQTPAMLLHPPALYFGFVVMTVPFAFAFGALMSGTGSSYWIVRSRRWTLAAWLSLSLGLLLGGAWAYHELGWGGYWGWDPVENSALLPWLTVTAFLHSVMIQEHRNMLKVWNIVLISISFLLTLFGTMLVRSGLLSSVHAFAQSSELLAYFTFFLIFCGAAVAFLMARRWKDLRSVNSFDSLLSRESAFLMNNWVFVVCAVVVLAGTTFPVISEAYYQWTQGVERKIAVSEPFYNTFIVPIGLILLVMTGIGPIVSWKKATSSNLKRNFLRPTIVGIVAALLAIYPFYVIGSRNPTGFPTARTIYAVLCVYASVFVLATVVDEYLKAIRVRLNRGSRNAIAALGEVTMRNRRRYGGYLIHVGVVLFYIGVLGSKGFQFSHRQIMSPGDTFAIAGYTLTYKGEPFQEQTRNATLVGIPLEVKRGERVVTTLKPARGFYVNNEESPTYEAAILRRFGGDLYIALGELTEDQQADLQIFYNPIAWVVLWLSPLVFVIGSVISFTERVRSVRTEPEGATS
jgi:cytochrome c-type biogenesis protein CcmF